MSTHGELTEPGEDRRPEVRIGDLEREEAVTHLGRAFAEGRLELHEYDERVASAYSAKTASDLLHLTADLPLAVPERRGPSRPRPANVPHKRTSGTPVSGVGTEIAKPEPAWLRPAWQAWAGVVTINLVVWFLIGIGSGDFPYFWPMWVAGPWGAILLMRTLAAKSRPRGS